jgi:hypothetical protein
MTKPVTRYDLINFPETGGFMEADDAGDWVKYEDIERLLKDEPVFFEFSKNEFDEAAFRRFCRAAGWAPEKVEEHVKRMQEAVAGDDPNGTLHAVLAAGFKRFEIATHPSFGTPDEPSGKSELVRYPDPPYELLGDSGKIYCPMCDGEGMVDPPSENRGGE